MSKTVVADGYGGPEVVAVQDIVLPDPGPGQVFIDVKAAGTNPFDYKSYSGSMGDDPDKLPIPLGLEVSGVIAAVAPGMNGFTGPLTVGDEVIATGLRGGYSEQVIVDAADVGHKPASLGFEQAAGLLLAGCTAWHLLTATRVEKGDTVLIHGGSGGVGLSRSSWRSPGMPKSSPPPARPATNSCVATAPIRSSMATGWRTGCGQSDRCRPRSTWSAPTRRWTPRSS